MNGKLAQVVCTSVYGITMEDGIQLFALPSDSVAIWLKRQEIMLGRRVASFAFHHGWM